MHAYFYGNAGALREFFGSEANNPNTMKNRNGQTALHIAVLHNNYHAIIALLMDIGADPNTRNQREQTALHIAAVDNNWRLLKVLLDFGADPNAMNEWGQTALDILMEPGPDPSTTKRFGGMALQNTALDILMEPGPDPSTTKRFGGMALQNIQEVVEANNAYTPATPACAKRKRSGSGSPKAKRCKTDNGNG
jgi:hypothetical protein